MPLPMASQLSLIWAFHLIVSQLDEQSDRPTSGPSLFVPTSGEKAKAKHCSVFVVFSVKGWEGKAGMALDVQQSVRT